MASLSATATATATAAMRVKAAASRLLEGGANTSAKGSSNQSISKNLRNTILQRDATPHVSARSNKRVEDPESVRALSTPISFAILMPNNEGKREVINKLYPRRSNCALLVRVYYDNNSRRYMMFIMIIAKHPDEQFQGYIEGVLGTMLSTVNRQITEAKHDKDRKVSKVIVKSGGGAITTMTKDEFNECAVSADHISIDNKDCARFIDVVSQVMRGVQVSYFVEDHYGNFINAYTSPKVSLPKTVSLPERHVDIIIPSKDDPVVEDFRSETKRDTTLSISLKDLIKNTDKEDAAAALAETLPPPSSCGRREIEICMPDYRAQWWSFSNTVGRAV